MEASSPCAEAALHGRKLDRDAHLFTNGRDFAEQGSQLLLHGAEVLGTPEGLASTSDLALDSSSPVLALLREILYKVVVVRLTIPKICNVPPSVST